MRKRSDPRNRRSPQIKNPAIKKLSREVIDIKVRANRVVKAGQEALEALLALEKHHDELVEALVMVDLCNCLREMYCHDNGPLRDKCRGCQGVARALDLFEKSVQAIEHGNG